MHTVLRDSLEEFLSGGLEPVKRKEIESHLNACMSCREEIRGMEEVSTLFGSLRSDDAFEPSPHFLAGLMRQVRGQSAGASFTGLFSLDFTFARRLVFACLLTLAVLGGYLAAHDADYTRAGIGPDELFAQHESPAFNDGPARDNMLVTLTAYDRH